MTREKQKKANRCPGQDLFDRLGDQWTTIVLVRLDDKGTMRFNELRAKVAGVSQRMLAQTLHRLEEYGLVARTAYPTVPPKVEYALTPLGKSFLVPLRHLISWADRNETKLRQARADYRSLPKQRTR